MGLVTLAAHMLDGSVDLGGVAPARAACWIGRRGLEALVSDLLQARSVDPGSATMRSRLNCLSVIYEDEPGLVTNVSGLWDQLSLACHHHAYELTPTTAEAQALIARLTTAASSHGEGVA